RRAAPSAPYAPLAAARRTSCSLRSCRSSARGTRADGTPEDEARDTRDPPSPDTTSPRDRRGSPVRIPLENLEPARLGALDARADAIRRRDELRVAGRPLHENRILVDHHDARPR